MMVMEAFPASRAVGEEKGYYTLALTKSDGLLTTMRWRTPTCRDRAAASAGGGRYMAAKANT